MHYLRRWRHACIFAPTIVGTLISSSAHAQWRGAGEIGAVSARGNSHSDNANAKLDISDQIEDWKHAFYLAGLYGSNDSVTSANRWEARWQADYSITQRLFWFGGLRYERDRFGAFSYQESAATGAGYKFFDDDITKFSTQLGVGAKRSREQTIVKDDIGNVTDRIYGDTALRGLITAGANFEHKLTDTTKIVDKLSVEAASDNTFIQNDLALQVAINAKFSLSVGYGVRENTSPPPDSERIDTITTLNLVYKIE
jgi:putative salt-induced outer membrane protein